MIPIVEGELSRRFPGRADRRVTDPDALRAACGSRAHRRPARAGGRLPRARSDVSVRGEWTFARPFGTWSGDRRVAGPRRPGDRAALPPLGRRSRCGGRRLDLTTSRASSSSGDEGLGPSPTRAMFRVPGDRPPRRGRAAQETVYVDDVERRHVDARGGAGASGAYRFTDGRVRRLIPATRAYVGADGTARAARPQTERAMPSSRSASSATRCCAPPPSRWSTSTRSCAARRRTSPRRCRTPPASGLAAPQIGVGLRVFTYWVDDGARAPDQPRASTSATTSRTATRAACRSPGSPSPPSGRTASWPRASTCTASPVTIEGTELKSRAHPARDRPPRRDPVRRPARPRRPQGAR